MDPVYLNGAGAYLPGQPVPNDQMARFIGKIDEDSERIGRIILRQNGIQTRHYALDEAGQPQHSVADMAAAAIEATVRSSETFPERLDFLASATTQGDLLVPGHASAVHSAMAQRDLAPQSLEVASFQSVCASAMMAARMAWLVVASGERQAALASGAEFPSRWFRPANYQAAMDKMADKETRMSAEFLRWTMSDGAGALIFAPEPNRHAPSFRVDWIEQRSLADQFDVCMYAGATPRQRFDLKQAWGNYAGGPRDAAGDGAILLLQDMVLLKRIIRAWVGEYLRQVERGRIVPEAVDWLLCHYSAQSLRQEIVKLMMSTGGMIDEEKWFSNLTSRGNTGSAAIFIMLEEFIASGRAKPGEKILCIVPESGWAIVSFMMLTAV